MNQIVEALHSTLEGRWFNKLIEFEHNKYDELESHIVNNDTSLFSKDTYKIPLIPEMVEETELFPV